MSPRAAATPTGKASGGNPTGGGRRAAAGRSARKTTASAPRATRRSSGAEAAPRTAESASRSAGASAWSDGYEGLDWTLHALARAGRIRTAVGPGLVQYGLWMHVIQTHRPEPADPDSMTGAVLQ